MQELQPPFEASVHDTESETQCPQLEANNPMDDPPPHCKETGAGGWDVLIGVSAIWIVELLLGVALIVWSGGPEALEALEDRPIALLVLSLLSGANVLLVTWLLVCRKYGKSIIQGFCITAPSPKAVVVAVLIAIGLALVAGLLTTRFSTGEHFFERVISTPKGFASLMFLLLVLPVVEEIYYRAFLYPVFEKKVGALAAFVIVVIWFAAAHSFQSLDDLAVIPIIGAVGAIFTLQRWITGSLTAPLITHWTYNFCLVLMTLVATYTG